MNNRICKRLRKEALKTAKEKFGKTSSIKKSIGGTVYWEKNSPVKIYKELKKDYYLKKELLPNVKRN